MRYFTQNPAESGAVESSSNKTSHTYKYLKLTMTILIKGERRTVNNCDSQKQRSPKIEVA
jgi:hypothetical protein